MSPIPFVVLALCGLTFGAESPVPRFDGRIAGGESTIIEEHPFQLDLRKNDRPWCGASIIGPYHALTAAHCIPDGSTRSLSLHAGTSYQSEMGSRHHARKITVHPRRQYDDSDYDYAIIEVDTPFPIGQSGIQAVELCSVEPSAGQTAVITGWGALSASNDYPSQLQVVNVPIISRAECQDLYYQYNITDRMICAIAENGGKDACPGDSGGPVIVDGKLCGVVSWSVGCAEAGHPGVYSNVADQLSWIQATARM